MTRLLYNQQTGALTAYPRPDDEPVLSLDRELYRVVRLVLQPVPEYDASAYRLQQVETYNWLEDPPDATGLDGTLTRSWELVPLPPPPPVQDWLGFASWLYRFPAMMTAMFDARGNYEQQGEPATTGLPAAMDEARLRQNYPAFALSWGQFLLASGLTPESLSAIVAKAAECNLPDEFIQSLAPTLQRARNEDGTFKADDPATPNINEAWEIG
jgi:hypothetical protein